MRKITMLNIYFSLFWFFIQGSYRRFLQVCRNGGGDSWPRPG